MRGVVISLLFAVFLAGPGLLGGAAADEAYVCEGGRVAYVRFGELEAMKRKDPCIAAYHGETISDGDETDGGAIADSGSRSTAGEPLPVVRTTATRAGPGPAVHIAPAAKDKPKIASPQAVEAMRNVATNARPVRAAAPLPVAHPDTDYRNIRILNAGPGESAIFRHVR